MQIHQLQVSFDPVEDRLRMRLSTTGGDEFRLFLTRRFVRLLWPEMMKQMEASAAVKAPAATIRREVVAFEREKAIAETDFSTPFQERDAAPRQFPLGEAPFIAARGQIRLEKQGSYRLTLDPQTGRGIELGLDDRLMHSLCRLIESAARGAQWDLPFFPAEPVTQAPAVEAPPRVLN